MTVHLGRYAGLAARVRGLRRFYAARLCRTGRFEFLRVLDDGRVVLASTPLNWQLDETVPVSIFVRDGRITACAGNAFRTADDNRAWQLASCGAGLLVADGAVSVDRIRVSSPESEHGNPPPPPVDQPVSGSTRARDLTRNFNDVRFREQQGGTVKARPLILVYKYCGRLAAHIQSSQWVRQVSPGREYESRRPARSRAGQG